LDRNLSLLFRSIDGALYDRERQQPRVGTSPDSPGVDPATSCYNITPAVAVRVRENVMRWFRANKRFCGWLALFALAVQIDLSFGHVHADDFGRGSTVVILSGATGPDAGPAPTSADNRPLGLADDYCAICAIIALDGSLFLPEPPALALPVGVLDTLAPDRTTALVPGDHRLRPRARSPPG